MPASKFHLLTWRPAACLVVLAMGAGLTLAGCQRDLPVETLSIETSVSPLLPDARVAISDAGHVTVVKTGCPKEPRPSYIRQRIVDLAVSQWRRFGYPVVNRSSRFKGLTDAQLQRLVMQRVPALRLSSGAEPAVATERENSVDGAIAGYWSVVDPWPSKAGDPAPRSRLRYRNEHLFSSRSWNEPWSAAFVSWVLCEAGADDIAFPKSSSHIQFLIDAQDMERSRLGWYRSVRPDLPAPIEAGDIICSARGTTDQQKISGALDSTMPAHCDIVVATDTGQGILLAIGGNVRDKVALSIISARITPKGTVLQPNLNTSVPMPWLRILHLKAHSAHATFENSFHVEKWSR